MRRLALVFCWMFVAVEVEPMSAAAAPSRLECYLRLEKAQLAPINKREALMAEYRTACGATNPAKETIAAAVHRKAPHSLTQIATQRPSPRKLQQRRHQGYAIAPNSWQDSEQSTIANAPYEAPAQTYEDHPRSSVPRSIQRTEPVWCTIAKSFDIPGMESERQKLYPTKGKDRGVEGKATVNCFVEDNQVYSGCRIVSEEPNDLGFGDAAIQILKTTTRNQPLMCPPSAWPRVDRAFREKYGRIQKVIRFTLAKTPQ